jgi:hypothetical protein
MGALTSWSLGLALLHHSLVQFAAFNAGHRSGWFSQYALLGDDLVIANTLVKDSYLKLMEDLGVKVNVSKSLLSPKGRALEFAKRFYLDNQNLSPISIKEILNSCRGLGSAYDLSEKYNLSLSSL